jgi:hypothetical protein
MNKEILIVADQIERIAVDDLKTNKNRIKIHSSDQIAKLAGLIIEFGFTVPLLVDGSNEIIAGRGRWLAAKSLGMPVVPCVRTTHLNDHQIRALILSDNRVAEDSVWDMPELKIELGALREFDEALLGLSSFSFEEIDDILDGILTEQSSDKDDPLPPVKFLNLGKHKIELSVDEHRDLNALFSEWAGHHQGYRGLVQHILDAVRAYNEN